MEFWRLYRLVYAKRWLIAAIMLISASVIFVGATLQAQRKTYQAVAYLQPLERALEETQQGTMRMEISASGSQGGISNLIMLLGNSTDLHMATAELLRLPEAARVRRVQKILEQNKFFAQSDAQIREEFARLSRQKSLTRAAARQMEREQIDKMHAGIADGLARPADEYGTFAPSGMTNLSLEQVAQQIRTRMVFEPVHGPLSTQQNPSLTNLIRVRSTHEREAGAKLFANIICVAFINFHTQRSASIRAAQLEELDDKLNVAQEKLRDARNKLVAFQRSTSTVNLNPEQSAAVSNVVRYEADRNALEAEIRASRASLAELRRLLAMAQKQPTFSTSLPEWEDPKVRAQEDKVSEAQTTFDRIKAEYLPNHPTYQKAEANLSSATRELARLKARPFTVTQVNPERFNYRSRVNDAEANLRSAEAKLSTLNEQLAAERAKVVQLPEAQANLAELKRQALLSEKYVAQLEDARNMRDIKYTGESEAGAMSIASQAMATKIGADENQRWVLMAYGAVLALIFGIALVVAMDALDNSIRSSTDVEKLLELPIAGIIPAQLPDPERASRITYLDPLSPVAESYRLLRTDLLFTAEDHPFKSLMLATGKPGQGATTTVCNLAIALAQAGKRVILVDADLRRPKLHNIFKVKNDVGLTSLLNDECEIEEALKATEMDNLLLLPSGPLPLNPSELLSSPRMRALHDQLKPHTDFVLFDTPSAIAFSDATVLSSFLDAVLLVVRANNVPRGSELHVKTMLNKAKANIIGVVLNGMNPDHVDSVHYHYHYYPVLATARDALGGNGSNGHGHGGGTETPLALPGGGGAPEPVGSPVAATASAGARDIPGGPGGQPMGDQTQSFTAPLHEKPSAAHQPFLYEQRKSLWRRLKAAVPFVVVAILIALLVLVISSSITPVPAGK